LTANFHRQAPISLAHAASLHMTQWYQKSMTQLTYVNCVLSVGD